MSSHTNRYVLVYMLIRIHLLNCDNDDNDKISQTETPRDCTLLLSDSQGGHTEEMVSIINTTL